jgi:hypothetical protein
MKCQYFIIKTEHLIHEGKNCIYLENIMILTWTVFSRVANGSPAQK